MKEFRQGDRVAWNSHDGEAVGEVEMKITEDTEAVGRTAPQVRGGPAAPQEEREVRGQGSARAVRAARAVTPAPVSGDERATPPTPAVTLGSVNVEAEDPQALAAFWAEVTGGTPAAGHDYVYLSPTSPGGFGMFFQPLTGLRPARNPIHLDLTVPWGTRVGTVERLLARGATHKWDVLEEHEHVQWTTLADPEGNLFCVAEHPPDGRG